MPSHHRCQRAVSHTGDHRAQPTKHFQKNWITCPWLVVVLMATEVNLLWFILTLSLSSLLWRKAISQENIWHRRQPFLSIWRLRKKVCMNSGHESSRTEGAYSIRQNPVTYKIWSPVLSETHTEPLTVSVLPSFPFFGSWGIKFPNKGHFCLLALFRKPDACRSNLAIWIPIRQREREREEERELVL